MRSKLCFCEKQAGVPYGFLCFGVLCYNGIRYLDISSLRRSDLHFRIVSGLRLGMMGISYCFCTYRERSLELVGQGFLRRLCLSRACNNVRSWQWSDIQKLERQCILGFMPDQDQLIRVLDLQSDSAGTKG
jgi:hypothetical protein